MAEQETRQRQLNLTKIYIKDMSFESPNSPVIFTMGDVNPKTNMNLRSAHTGSQNDVHEVVLTITIETKHEDKTLFLIELQQAGLFHITGYSAQELDAIVGSFCPNTLFPYAREVISGVISKGGFPEFLLQPINFDALYAESKRKAQEQAQAQQPAPPAAGGNGGDGSSH
ncbi:MAG: protein-export chaperone SecB [Gammaproteobacteria bacterium]|nr:protein-export chaperone SecB [Gammaproteobacteria bacterium]MDH4254662.1 protein-export chaperone SecB [Gammaproteobacteria bacterium]MDH5310040.1 protein-export chaperone SecB [Gammaproteobacteria bacterium]